MSCVCILWRGGMSCPVSVYCDRVGCHVLCLYTVTEWGVMSCVCILWQSGVSCPVPVAWHSNDPLLQAGTVAIWPQMLDLVAHLNPNKHTSQQTNKRTNKTNVRITFCPFSLSQSLVKIYSTCKYYLDSDKTLKHTRCELLLETWLHQKVH